MAKIRTKEKVKDIKTIDRAKTAAYHVKKGYVRTKEQLTERGAEEADSTSGYAGSQVEKEMQRAGDFAAHRVFSQSRKNVEPIRDQYGNRERTKGREETPFSETGAAGAGTGMTEGQKEEILKCDAFRDIYERNHAASVQREIKEKDKPLRYGGYQTVCRDTTENPGIKDKEVFSATEKRLSFEKYDRTVQARASPTDPQPSFYGKRDHGQEQYVKERLKAERYIKEPAHAVGGQNRPLQKYFWDRHKKGIRTSEIPADRLWYQQHPMASGQYAYAVERFHLIRQRSVTSMGRGLGYAGEYAGTGIRKIGETAKAAFTGSKALFHVLLSSGAVALLIILVTALFGSIFLTSLGNDPEGTGENVSQEVIAYTPLIQQYAQQYGIPLFVNAVQAMMMQESGGQGTDPMQSSECPYNTRFPNTPGAITEPEYSIAVGIQYFASCLMEAGCESPMDMDKLSLAWQGYNFGNGYITWAIRNFGGYSEANAQVFSEQQAASHGWSGYGDPQYVPHVMRYYQYSGGALAGDSLLVDVARTQIGNRGGQPYWSWFGFGGRVPWCACFVSWCADQCGYLEQGIIPRFSVCDDGIRWFQSKGQYFTGGYIPKTGDLIFFDWGRDGISDHVGIVTSVEGSVVHTVEGNTSDTCAERTYLLGDGRICGYGRVIYSGSISRAS